MLVPEAECWADFDGLRQILRVEGDLGRLALDSGGHLNGRAHGVIVAMGQGEVARLSQVRRTEFDLPLSDRSHVMSEKRWVSAMVTDGATCLTDSMRVVKRLAAD
jgi:hypothetical protein